MGFESNSHRRKVSWGFNRYSLTVELGLCGLVEFLAMHVYMEEFGQWGLDKRTKVIDVLLRSYK
jgi:hypothetical protein